MRLVLPWCQGFICKGRLELRTRRWEKRRAMSVSNAAALRSRVLVRQPEARLHPWSLRSVYHIQAMPNLVAIIGGGGRRIRLCIPEDRLRHVLSNILKKPSEEAGTTREPGFWSENGNLSL